MKRLPEILVFLKKYPINVGLNLFFNLLMIFFSLFSIATIYPFLEVLFKVDQSKVPTELPEFKFDSETILSSATWHINQFIQTHGEAKALLFISIGVVTIFLLKNLTRYLAMYHLARIRTGVVRDLRDKVYKKVLQLPLSYFSQKRKGDIISRLSGDVFEVEWSIIGSLEMLFRDPLTFLFFLGSLFLLSWKLTLFVIILLPISGWGISAISKPLKRVAKRGQTQMGLVLSLFEESLTGLRIIKAFNAEREAEEKFTGQNNKYFGLMTKLYRLQYLASPISEFIAILVLVIVLWYGGNLILTGDTAFNGKFFIVYLALFSQLIPPAKSFSEAFFKINKGLASLDRINEILHADLKIENVPGAKELTGFEHELEFRNVSFRYETDPVLKNISFTLKKGQTVALVGPSGGGKSTLADLIPRFHDIESGEILLDGVNIKECDLASLRGLMGVVSQKPILFNDTVHNNIALGASDASEKAVRQAAEIANAREFIETNPEGYTANIGDGGSKLSGGQQQRLSIARAVLKNPPILILDEATSALDTQSEKLVQDALQKLMENRTSLVIAHRLSTIQHADLILVIQDGKIIEQGNHETLLDKGGVYRKLTELQSLSA